MSVNPPILGGEVACPRWATPLGELILDAVARYPRATAFRERGRSLTFAEAGERIARLANALRAESPDPGRCVGILLRNRIEYAEADLAIALAGKVRAPVNPRLADEERIHALANVAAETLITEATELDRVESMLPFLPDLRRVLLVDALGTLPERFFDYEAALAAASTVPPMVHVHEEDPAVVRHTSGTTGRPKGATISVRARLAAMRHSMREEHNPRPDDCFLHAAPMGHASGDKVLTFFHRGAANAFVDRFEAERFADDVEKLQATGTFLVPTMLRMLLRDGQGAPRLRNLTYGGSPIDAETRTSALDRFGPILTQIYGTTETPHPVLVLGHDEHLLPETADATGRPARGIDVRLGEDNELWVRGPNVMSGYWNDSRATAEVLIDGWYRTGDVARVLPGGWYTIVDRLKDLIITGGLNVYPAEVEAALLRHPAVAEAAVYGAPDPLWGEVVVAAVVPAAGSVPTSGELIAHCEPLLAGYKKPRRIHLVEALPKGATGKILKRALRAGP